MHIIEQLLTDRAIDTLRAARGDRSKATTAFLNWLAADAPSAAWLLGDKFEETFRRPVRSLIVRASKDPRASAAAAATQYDGDRHVATGGGGSVYVREHERSRARAGDQRHEFEAVQKRRLSLFDTMLTRAGPIGDLVWSALPRLAKESARDAALLLAIYHAGTPADPNTPVRDLLTEAELRRMAREAERTHALANV